MKKREELKSLIKRSSGSVVINEIAEVKKTNGTIELFVYIANKTFCYEIVSTDSYEIIFEISNLVSGCLERYAAETWRALLS